ncbi:division/cell wall cluster transcriptional repressor MraZ [Paracoccus sp. M683]|uniref:division/cell wall cluster transcriptional repressor MraZ n=1 Tax=Paracoccus sp. M683 TaxID=2594268 RepID=UPI00117E18FE|nr:division/cell wall cluster transcriptional repressor MraZ [Paracoccus sp. M683]TRW97220.1 division/cell wall cluster transcriptional repressor MraZ [Paracoccus sp. M683]
MARRFRGSEEVKVDTKGRVSIPAKFRRVFEQCDPDWQPGNRPQLVIVYGTSKQNHLQLYTMEAIEDIDRQIDRMQRGTPERAMLEASMNGFAEEAEIDGDGRLLLPQKLREKIGLTERAFFIASGEYLKLWTPEAYAEDAERLEARIPDFEPGADPLSLLPARDEG